MKWRLCVTVDYCGGYVVREWACDVCGYMWNTEHWEDHLHPIEYPECPKCKE